MGLLLLLCARRRDADDLDHRQLLTVAVTATVVALGLVREAVDLGTLGGTHDPGRDHCTLQLRGGGEPRPAVDQEDGREVDLAAVVDTETLDLELFTGLDLVLLTA